MIKSFSSFLGLVLFGMGILLSLWLSTSVIGKSYSQNTQRVTPLPPVRPPGATKLPPNPAATTQAPPAASAPSAPTQTQAPPSTLPPGSPPELANPGAPADPAAPAVGKTDEPAAPPEDVPVFQNPEGYSYDPTGRRDPFRPFGQAQATSAPDLRGDQAFVPADPLQQFDVSQLKVVGIMWEVRNPRAMLKDPAGKLHMIQRQTRVGRSNGFVAAIREGEIVVVEPSIGDDGLQTATTRILTLTR